MLRVLLGEYSIDWCATSSTSSNADREASSKKRIALRRPPEFCAHGLRVLLGIGAYLPSKKEIVLSPIAMEVVRRIDALFEIERSINGCNAEERRARRQQHSAALVSELEAYMRNASTKLSRGNDLFKAMNYMFKRWPSFTRFLEDGRVCHSNNAAERALRGIALGRKSWLFCGSDRGGERAAAMSSLIVTAKMNDVDPQLWLADVLARIATHPAHQLDELLPWNWAKRTGVAQAA